MDNFDGVNYGSFSLYLIRPLSAILYLIMLTSFSALFFSLIIPSALLIIAFILASYPQENQEFVTPFECGFDPDSTARIPFSLRFFLLAVIFLVFDVEIALLTPFPLTLQFSPINELIVPFSIFIVILILGLLHE